MSSKSITVVGAGLAGCEAAWQALHRGVPVTLVEMKPLKFTPAHHSEKFAELVCSNSLRAAALSERGNAPPLVSDNGGCGCHASTCGRSACR